MSDSDLVGVYMLVVPDGMDSDMVRFSLQITPGKVDGRAAVPLSKWPSEIHKLVRKLRVLVGRVGVGQASVTDVHCLEAVGSDTRALMAKHLPDGVTTLAADADALWNAIFSGGDLTALAKAVTVEGSTPESDTKKTKFFHDTQASEIDASFESFYEDMIRNAVIGKTFAGAALPKGAYWDAHTWAGHADWLTSSMEGGRAAAKERSKELARGSSFADTPKAFTATALRAHAATRFAAYLAQEEFPDDYNPNCNPPDDPAITEADRVRMLLGQVLAIPTLAKYLGLVVDVEISRAKWNACIGSQPDADWIGVVALEPTQEVDLGEPRNFPLTDREVRERQWTVCLYSDLYLGPCEKHRLAKSDAALHDKGLLLMRSLKTDNRTRRFSLGGIDVVNTYVAMANRARDVAARTLSGLMATDEFTLVPSSKGRGIVLYDAEATEAALQAEIEHQASAKAKNDLQLNCSEDLVRGLRIDVALMPDASSVEAGRSTGRWRTLSAREVRCTRLPELFVNDPTVVRVQYRDDSFVATGVVGERETQSSREAAAPQELFAWQGESLAVQSQLEDKDRQDLIDSPLPVGLSQSLPTFTGTGPDRRPPPLRDGKGYLFAARLTYLNGCGLEFEKGAALHANDARGHVLGTPPGSNEGGIEQPYIFVRQERIAPPKVCLPWDSALVTTPESEFPVLPGHTVDCIVVHGRATGSSAHERFLIPPDVSFDVAEQQGQFDCVYDDEPKGAFRGAVKIQLGTIDGSLPVARGGGWVDGDQINSQDKGVSRGSVVVLDRAAPKPGREYYADRYAYKVRATIVGGNAPLHEYDTAGQSVAFWEGAPNSARPVILEVAAGPKRNDERAYFASAGTERRVPRNGTLPVALHKIRVVLAPAESIDIRLESVSDAKHFLTSHASGRRIMRLYGESASTQYPAMRSLDAFQTLSLGEGASLYAGRCTVRMVHPVPKPLKAPLPLDGKDVGVHAVVLTVLPDSTPTPQRVALGGAAATTWREYVHAHLGKPWCEWMSAEGGATCYFVGCISAHRDSTGALRCDARWEEHGPEAMQSDSQTGHWTYAPPVRHAVMFNLPTIPPRSIEDTPSVDLVLEGDEPRALAYSFPDGRARRLRPRLVGTSRFTEFYPKPKAVERPFEALGPHEVASSSFEQAPNVWVPCTFRPPPPVLDRSVPVLLPSFGKEGGIFTASRRSMLRIYLETKGWYASGEDERLAVVFHPVGSVCDFAKPGLGPFVNVLTQWAFDPLHPTSAPGTPISVRHFQGGEIREKLQLPVPVAPVGAKQKDALLEVSAMVFRPELDPELGLYCDIGIDAPEAVYWPFVRLGLARYQEHAVDGLQLSTPVGLDVRWLQDRDVSVSFKSPRQVELKVFGPVPRSSNPAGDVGVPVLDVRLMRRHGAPGGATGSFRWQEVVDKNDQPIRVLALPPKESLPIRWTCKLDLPHHRRRVNYGLQVEESMVIRNQKGEEIGRVGPTFATLIDLGR